MRSPFLCALWNGKASGAVLEELLDRRATCMAVPAQLCSLGILFRVSMLPLHTTHLICLIPSQSAELAWTGLPLLDTDRA